jgi:oligopeptide/dipeptide ABC transporter ATP-binding protein
MIAVMYLGKVVEMGPTQEIYENPAHAYTKALISAVPVPDPTRKRDRILIPGDVPSPINPPKGCAFGSRMNSPKYEQSIGRELKVKQLSEGHWVLDCTCCVES